VGAALWALHDLLTAEYPKPQQLRKAFTKLTIHWNLTFVALIGFFVAVDGWRECRESENHGNDGCDLACLPDRAPPPLGAAVPGMIEA